MSDKTYNVSYVANYFTLHTSIQAPDENVAEVWARENLLKEYGIDLDECGAECVEVVISA
jgi:hypothetical protein